MDAYAKSKTKKEARDKRATPPELFDFIVNTLGVKVIWDVCAEGVSAKANAYWDETDNALEQNWASTYRTAVEDGVVYGGVPVMWMNPPYSDPATWCRYASEAAKMGAIIVGLLPDDRSTGWYQRWVHPTASVVYVTDKRIPFLDEQGVPQFGNPKGSIVPIWTPWQAGNTQEAYLKIPPELVAKWRRQVNEAKRGE